MKHSSELAYQVFKLREQLRRYSHANTVMLPQQEFLDMLERVEMLLQENARLQQRIMEVSSE